MGASAPRGRMAIWRFCQLVKVEYICQLFQGNLEPILPTTIYLLVRVAVISLDWIQLLYAHVTP